MMMTEDERKEEERRRRQGQQFDITHEAFDMVSTFVHMLLTLRSLSGLMAVRLHCS